MNKGRVSAGMPRQRAIKTSLPLRELAQVLLLAPGYFVAGKLGLRLAFVNPSASAVWPPSGIAQGALLIPGMKFGASSWAHSWSTSQLPARWQPPPVLLWEILPKRSWAATHYPWFRALIAACCQTCSEQVESECLVKCLLKSIQNGAKHHSGLTN